MNKPVTPSTPILTNLNEEQRHAVTTAAQNCRILAGAGSGKTTVLVRRIAWLLHEYGLSPYAILAVTFTNKAARELRERLQALLPDIAASVNLGTFHRICYKLLKQHADAAHLDPNFQIIDSADQLRLIKQITQAFNLDEKKWPARNIQQFIMQQKEKKIRPENVAPAKNSLDKTYQQYYATYESFCQKQNLVDFTELLLRSYELLKQNQTLALHYQMRYTHILVDEFQDTNQLQYDFLRLLSTPENSLYIVGDDDQSIYGWRGARVENFQYFCQDYAAVDTIRLTRNYRSTGHILSAANTLIAHNTTRLGKDLWTQDNHGDKVCIYHAFNEIDEGRFIANQLKKWKQTEQLYKDAAILYRSNAQSRALEEALIQSGIPYQIYGGLRFFERQEIKDTLAYLRLALNPADNYALERIINLPPRGLGEKTIEKLKNIAENGDFSLWESLLVSIDQALLPKKTIESLRAFASLLTSIEKNSTHIPLSAQITFILQETGLLQYYKNLQNEYTVTRLENLAELESAAAVFEGLHGEDPRSTANEFLLHATLESGELTQENAEDCVQLMTLHAAKGLEFPLVFIAGMEEDLLPHALSKQNPAQLEEERRLCYVGMTRAMKQLYLSFAENRRLHGYSTQRSPSRFLKELPTNCIHPVNAHKSRQVYEKNTINFTKHSVNASQEDNNFSVGKKIWHPHFGQGMILKCEGKDDALRLQIHFNTAGVKWLIARYANLKPLKEMSE